MTKTLKNQKGFTLIELVVVMVILALLAAVAVPKFIDLQKQAEAASVKKVIGNLRSALSIRVAQGLVNDDDLATLVYNSGDAASLAPMGDLLSNKPETYLGEIPDSNDRGSWFDATAPANRNNTLVYVLKNDDIVDNDYNAGGGSRELRYRIVAITENVSGVSTVVGLELEQARTYTWNY